MSPVAGRSQGPAAGDTIVAVATAPGRGAIGIVRLSGAGAGAIAERLAGSLPEPRRAALRRLSDADGNLLDEVLVLRFPGPGSYTGEDIVEFQGHGGRVTLELIVAACESLGARRAQAGEYSLRAYLNGRLDLTQAEAVADLVDSGSVARARAALRSLSGEFSDAVRHIERRLIGLRTDLEAGIDFADEGLELDELPALAARATALRGELTDLTRAAERGRQLNDGLVIVIAGRPNAGKSSLLNRLCGHDAAIVSDEPGTTRDVVREHVVLDGMTLELLDTAGLRVAAGPVEAEGIRRAQAEMARADHVLYVVDAADDAALAGLDEDLAALPSAAPRTVIYAKCDAAAAPTTVPRQAQAAIAVSTVTGQGIDELQEHLRSLAGDDAETEGTFSARARHVGALCRADRHVARACEALSEGEGLELVAEELRLAQAALGEVCGEYTSDDLLGEIFSTFCIGK